jgi:hypothetical protein
MMMISSILRVRRTIKIKAINQGINRQIIAINQGINHQIMAINQGNQANPQKSRSEITESWLNLRLFKKSPPGG